MAFVSEEIYNSERTVSVVACSRCGDDGLIWDRTSSGKPWLYDVKLASEREVTAFEADPTSLPYARKTDNYGLVLVLKYRAHMCPEAQEGPFSPDLDRPNDLDVNDADEIMGLRIDEGIE